MYDAIWTCNLLVDINIQYNFFKSFVKVLYRTLASEGNDGIKYFPT